MRRDAAGSRFSLFLLLLIAVGTTSVLLSPANAGPTLHGGRGILSASSPDTVDPRSVEVSLWTKTFVDHGGGRFTTGPLAAAMGLTPTWDFSLAFDMVDPADPAQRLGDTDPITMTLKHQFVEEKLEMPNMAFQLGLVRAARTVDLNPQVSVGKAVGPIQIFASTGYFAALADRGGERRAITLATGGQVPAGDWSFGAELVARLDESAGYGGGSLAFGPLASLHVGEGFSLVWAAEGAAGRQVPFARLYLGFIYAVPSERDRDRDGDGLADLVDLCAFDEEDINEYQDDDGCPEGGAPEADSEPGPRRFTTETPRFRMRIPMAGEVLMESSPTFVASLTPPKRDDEKPAEPEPEPEAEPAAEAPKTEPPRPDVGGLTLAAGGLSLPEPTGDEARRSEAWALVPAAEGLSVTVAPVALLGPDSPVAPEAEPAVAAVPRRTLGDLARENPRLGAASYWPILYLANMDGIKGEPNALLAPEDAKILDGFDVPMDKLVMDFHYMRAMVKMGKLTLPLEVETRSGETLELVAARVYGDKRLWTVLKAGNLDRVKPDGSIDPGTTLRVPR